MVAREPVFYCTISCAGAAFSVLILFVKYTRLEREGGQARRGYLIMDNALR